MFDACIQEIGQVEHSYEVYVNHLGRFPAIEIKTACVYQVLCLVFFSLCLNLADDCISSYFGEDFAKTRAERHNILQFMSWKFKAFLYTMLQVRMLEKEESDHPRHKHPADIQEVSRAAERELLVREWEHVMRKSAI